MTSSELAKEQERLRRKAEQELRTARQAKIDVLYSIFATQRDKAEAHAKFYAAINKAASDQILTPAQIQEAAIISRQRYHQIVSGPTKQVRATTVRLPEEDV